MKKKSLVVWNSLKTLLLIIITFSYTIVIYLCNNFFTLKQTFILTGCREGLWLMIQEVACVARARPHWERVLDRPWALCLPWMPEDGNIAQTVARCIISFTLFSVFLKWAPEVTLRAALKMKFMYSRPHRSLYCDLDIIQFDPSLRFYPVLSPHTCTAWFISWHTKKIIT